METNSLLVALLFLAALNERAMEYALGRWHKPTVDRFLPLVSLAVGVVEALALKLNALVLVDLSLEPVVGQIATGVVLGMGSNAIHFFFGKVKK